MGCCCSGEEEAKATELPPPTFGTAVHVQLKKQGMMDADYDVHSLKALPLVDPESGAVTGQSEVPSIWMLVDAVGSIWSGGFKYFLKFRPKGQEKSLVLGCADLKDDCDHLHFQITGRARERGVLFFNEDWSDSDGDGYDDPDVEDFKQVEVKTIKANFVFMKRALLFADYEMTQLCGRLQIAGSGVYSRRRREIRWMEEVEYEEQVGEQQVGENEDGSPKMEPVMETRTRMEPREHVDDDHCARTKAFQYKMNAYSTDVGITYYKQGGGSFFKKKQGVWQGTSANGSNIFKVTGDGESSAEIETGDGTDPVNTILAAFAVSCKMDPAEFHSKAAQVVHSHISLGMPPGATGGFGPTTDVFEQQYPTAQLVPPPPIGGNYYAVAQAMPVAMPAAGVEGAGAELLATQPTV